MLLAFAKMLGLNIKHFLYSENYIINLKTDFRIEKKVYFFTIPKKTEYFKIRI